jgi:hypothetical protein
VIVYFGQFKRKWQIIEKRFSIAKGMYSLGQKFDGPNFGRFFHKLIWSPWLPRHCGYPQLKKIEGCGHRLRIWNRRSWVRIPTWV